MLERNVSKDRNPMWKDIDKEKFTTMWNNNSSYEDIKTEFNISNNIVCDRVKMFGLTRRCNTINKEEIINLYFNENKTVVEIKKITGHSKRSIYKTINSYEK